MKEEDYSNYTKKQLKILLFLYSLLVILSTIYGLFLIKSIIKIGLPQ